MRPWPLKYLFCVLLFCAAHNSFGQQIREVPDSVADAMKKEEAFKYANDPSFWQKEKPGGSSALIRLIAAMLESPVMKWVLYLIIAIVLAYVIYQVIAVNNFFTGPRRIGKKSRASLGGDDVPEDVEERIAAAIAAGEFRQAIRYYYLKTLGLLNAGHKIQLHAKSTNYDYMQQMQDQSNGNDFRRLTRIYEYVWYGEFQPDATQFEMIRSGFNQFNEQA
jgi:hypothetical protein